MKKNTKWIWAIVALVVFVGGGALLVFALRGVWGTGRVPANTILELDLEQTIIETTPDDPLALILDEGKLKLIDVVATLDRAAEDDRVVGLVANVGNSGNGLAVIQELRDAILAFRESGKPAIAFSETFGEFSPGNSSYYLASAFDEIYLQPSGDIGLNGLLLESMFLRGVFDKLGIEPQLDHRKEYKNAKNMYTETEFTEPHREALAAIMDSWFDQIVGGISEARGFAEGELEELIDRGPFLGPEALEEGLVDGLIYRDELIDLVREKVGEEASLRYLASYRSVVGPRFKKGPKVALIYGIGPVMRGASSYDPLADAQSMGSETVARAFRAAIDDEDVEAILFRVDSPGGSYVASDTIWRETVRAREAGKPVIVSMGNVAGSGGYFVAMASDAIVAQPATITGSIGVLGGKLLTNEMWSKIGLSFDDVQTSDNAAFWNSSYPYSEAGEERFQAWLDRVYEDFTGKVAEGRELPLERVQEIAKGRIWSGADALEIGLVDRLGGFPAAISTIKERLELDEEDSIRLVTFPTPKTPFEALFGRDPDSSEDFAAASVVRAVRSIQPLGRLAQRLGLLDARRPGLWMSVEPPRPE